MRNRKRIWSVCIEINRYGHSEIIIKRREMVGGIPRAGNWPKKYIAYRAEILHRAHRLQNALWDLEYNE